jgi:hypothetical protein
MSTQAIDATDRSYRTTDDRLIGSAAPRLVAPAASVERLTAVSDALLDGDWAMLLRGELEEAVDTLLLRATLASTLTVTGGIHRLFA